MNHTKHQLATIVLAATASASCLAASDHTTAPTRVEVIRSLAEIAAAHAVLGMPSFQSTYEMESGERLTVGGRARALRVRYGDGPVETLRHDGQGRFVSQDGRISLRFALNTEGEAERVTLAMPAHGAR